MPNTIKVECEVSDDFIRDVMTNAVETRSLVYWATLRLVMRDQGDNVIGFQVADAEMASERYHDLIHDGHDKDEAIELVNNDGDLWNVIDKDAIIRGIQRAVSTRDLADDIRSAIMTGVVEDDAGEVDATGCDVIVQLAIFDDIIYS